ncbi:MAG: putative transposase [Cellvibrionaceae bacterium]|jgi:putative transposase
MSRRGNCHDTAVTESFFSLPKDERSKRKFYKTRAEARSEVFKDKEPCYKRKSLFCRLLIKLSTKE